MESRNVDIYLKPNMNALYFTPAHTMSRLFWNSHSLIFIQRSNRALTTTIITVERAVLRVTVNALWISTSPRRMQHLRRA